MCIKLNSNLFIAIFYVKCTSNNTVITVVQKDKTIAFGSCGILGLKGSKRSTPYASQSLSNVLGKKIYLLGVRFVVVKINGFGNGRVSVLKGLQSSGIKILRLLDITPVPFNGCKISKKRRI